jgi:battenin
MSTGAILLADIIPSFIIKSLSPFLPYNANYRVLVSCLASSLSFLVVAFADAQSTVIFGVVLTSFASGLGEPTFLAHSTHYSKNVISTWSSGTGGAGVIGALSYSVLRECGLTSQQTLLLMLLVPTIEVLTYFFLLSNPASRGSEGSDDEQRPLIAQREVQVDHDRQQQEVAETPPLNSLREKLAFIPSLMVYFVPLMMVYFFEYFINQGLVRS